MKNILISLGVVVLLAGCAGQQHDPRVAVQSGVGSDTLASNIITRPIGQAVSFIIGEGIIVDNVKEVRTRKDSWKYRSAAIISRCSRNNSNTKPNGLTLMA